MKRNLTLLSLIFVLCSSKFIAQTFSGIRLTGFNQDVIAESVPAANYTGSVSIDASGYVLYSILYTSTANNGGLIANGVYTSSSRTYSLAPYNLKNTLRVAFSNTDSLSLVNPGKYSVLSLLGFSSGGDALIDITLKYTDGTSVVYTSKTNYNWTSSQQAYIAGFGKTKRSTDAIYVTSTEPKMYSIDLPIACANQSKMLSKILVKNNTNGAVSYIFAAAGVGRSNTVATAIPAVCKGTNSGSAKVLGVDMYGPLTYTWNSTPVQNTQMATNLPAGSYTVTVADGNGCVYTNSVAITEPATSFSVTSITSNSVLCAAATTGTAQVNVVGGNTPYAFSWVNTSVTTSSIGGLAGGTYTVIASDNNGCSITATTTVAKPNVTISVSTSSLICGSPANATGTVTSVTGAPGPYTYTWMPSSQTSSVATSLGAGVYSVMVQDANACINTTTVAISAPVVNLTSTATTCTLAAGSATVGSVTGGAGGPYTYSWTPSAQTGSVATGLAAGNYTVIVTDAAACATTKTLSISALNPTLSVSTTSLLCASIANGSASVSVSGGAGGPYTYTWTSSPVQTTATANNLASGSYSVIVKGASGCVATQTFAIAKPAIALTTMSTSCKGLQSSGSASVTSVGGVGPYSYTWDGSSASGIGSNSSINGLDEGSYTVTVTDANSCVTSTTFAIAAPNTASLTAVSSVSAATCAGINDGKAKVSNVIGGTLPISYLWNTNPPQYTPIATGLASPNTFVCSIIDYNGCVLNKPVTIYPGPTNLLIYVSPSNTVCPKSTVQLSITGLTGTGTYTWNTGAHTTSVSVVTPTISTSTVYSFTGTASSGCVVTGSTTIITSTLAGSPCPPVGINEQSAIASSFNLYPNPNNGQFVLAFDQMQNNAVLEVVDALGKLVISQAITGVETTVNTTALQNGMYFVIVRDENKIIARTKIIKQ